MESSHAKRGNRRWGLAHLDVEGRRRSRASPKSRQNVSEAILVTFAYKSLSLQVDLADAGRAEEDEFVQDDRPYRSVPSSPAAALSSEESGLAFALAPFSRRFNGGCHSDTPGTRLPQVLS